MNFGSPTAARAGDDQPTQWQIDARAEMLQTAPPPAEKPVICIVDTGVTPTPDLDIVSRTALDGGNPDDVTARPGHYGHGTTVAHMAAGKVNGWGSSGVFPHARIASVRIFDELNQRVPWQRYVNALARCSEVRPRPRVAVLSLNGVSSGSGDDVVELRNAIRNSQLRDQMNVIAAAGNGGATVEMPAAITEAFGVAASSSDWSLCPFSARGENADVAAPGCHLGQAGWDGRPWDLSGTSFAAPLVAGLIAALRSYSPHLEPAAAEDLLVSSARGGSRVIDAGGALRATGVDLISPFKSSEGEAATVEAVIPGEAEAESRPRDLPAYRPAVARTLDPRSARQNRLPKPVVVIRRRGSHIFLFIRNWVHGLRSQVRDANRLVSRKGARIAFRTRSRNVSVRLVSSTRSSRWHQVSLPLRAD